MVSVDPFDGLFPDRFETDRLRFARFDRDVGVEEFYRAFSDGEPGIEEVARYLPYGPLASPKAAADRLARRERQWDDDERAQWAIRPREGEPGAGDLAGMGALIVEWDRRLAKPAIWLRRRFWGRGYSGERADALLSVAFEHLDLDCVAVPVQVGNERSRRAVEAYVDRHGGRHEGVLRNDGRRPSGPVDRHRFTITREEYEGSR
jgi:RimJ/RimL family protein N-acetyltransferase